MWSACAVVPRASQHCEIAVDLGRVEPDEIAPIERIDAGAHLRPRRLELRLVVSVAGPATRS